MPIEIILEFLDRVLSKVHSIFINFPVNVTCPYQTLAKLPERVC